MRRTVRAVVVLFLAAGSALTSPPAADAAGTHPLPHDPGGQATLPPATVGLPYSVQLLDGWQPGTDVFTARGRWPAGITLSPSGLVSGTALLPASARLKVVSRDGGRRVGVQWLVLTVGSGVPQLDATLVPVAISLVDAIS